MRQFAKKEVQRKVLRQTEGARGVVDFTDITNIIVPFFNKNPIIGIKLYGRSTSPSLPLRGQEGLIDVKFTV